MRYSTEIKPDKSFIPPAERKQMSRWKSSLNKSKWGDTRLHNELTNSAFMLLIRRVKKLYKGSNIEAYQRDHRIDSALNPTTMETFITPDLYLEIECEYVHHRCQVLYNISQSPHAEQIAIWLKEYPFSIASKEQALDGGVAAYFDRVKAFQAATFFTTL